VATSSAGSSRGIATIILVPCGKDEPDGML
jgi:hypothetical protein